MNTVCDRDWPEDFEHENGNYMNTCCECRNTFTGHKRRVVCKACATIIQGGEAVAWRVTGRDGLTVTAQYPEWAEADCLLTITPLYTHPADQVAEGLVVARDKLQGLLWYADQLLAEVNAGARYAGCTAAEAEHSDSDYLEISALLNGGRS